MIMSGDAVLKKLYYQKASQHLIVNAPASYLELIGDRGFDGEPVAAKKGNYDFVQVFAVTQKELLAVLKKLAPFAKEDAYFWACYPKGGKLNSDIKRETVWAAFDTITLNVVSSAAIDDTWTALRARPYTN
jgi:hypothetical protein